MPWSKRLRTLGSVALGSVMLLGGALWVLLREPPHSLPRLVVLYAPCTVNRSFLAPYNPQVTYTPFLEAFARTGTVFTKHHTEEGQSGIAYAALFSGNQAMRHGVYKHPTRLNDSLYLITEAFKDGGYDVFFWADQIMASPGLNYGQGVEPDHVYPNVPLSGESAKLRAVLARLKTDPTYKAFLLTNFTVTHYPYRQDRLNDLCHRMYDECAVVSGHDIERYKEVFRVPDSRWQNAFESVVEKLAIQPDELTKLIKVAELVYKSNIRYLDQIFGGVLAAIDAAGLSDESLIAFTADHGEALYRDNLPLKWTHGFMLAPEDIVVPLIIRGPGVPGGRYNAVTRSIDVFPTLARLSGLPVPANIMGVDLVAAMRGKVQSPPLVAFSHTSLLPNALMLSRLPSLSGRFPRNDPSEMWVAARDGDLAYKLTSPDGLIFSPHVYDWEADPAERADLYDANNAVHQDMVRRLAAYKNALREGFSYWTAVGGGRLPTEREEEILRSLGYIP